MSSTLRVLVVLGAGLALACDPGPGEADAAVPRDARVAEGGLLDTGVPLTDASLPGPDASRDGGAALCAWSVCDPRTADGCAEGACTLEGEAASCTLVPGALGRDAACTALADCAPGLACFLVEGLGRCGRICCPGEVGSCTAGAVCGGSGVLIDGTATSWGRCRAVERCDVFTPDAVCEDREGCYIVDGAGTTECRVAGLAGSGEACLAQEDCQAGYFCGGVGVAKRCVRICRLGEDDCGARESCVAQAHTPAGSGLCSTDGTSAI